jgi:hypothetical protein
MKEDSKCLRETIEFEHEWKIEGLAARGPFPGLEEKLSLFGQFVGDWDILEDRYAQQDATEIKQTGEVHFDWIIEGRAIQDIWMMHDKDNHRAVPLGTTIRFYDAEIDSWQSTWISPIQGIVKTFVARKVGNEIVLDGKTKKGYPEKWIFSRITSNSFRWHSEETRDEGKNWILTEEMQIQRQNAGTKKL